MGWDNPPVPWRELQRRMSWRTEGNRTGGEPAQDRPAQDRPAQARPAQDRPRPAKPAEPGPRVPRPGSRRHETATPWAELHCHSSFSFLDGAGIPDERVAEAARLGLEVLAITDHDGMYGVPQFAQAAARLADHGIRLGTVFGAELSLHLGLSSGQAKRAGVPDPEGRHLLVLARDPEGYRRLCAVISAARLAGGEKGRPVYDLDALAQAHGGHRGI